MNKREVGISVFIAATFVVAGLCVVVLGMASYPIITSIIIGVLALSVWGLFSAWKAVAQRTGIPITGSQNDLKVPTMGDVKQESLLYKQVNVWLMEWRLVPPMCSWVIQFASGKIDSKGPGWQFILLPGLWCNTVKMQDCRDAFFDLLAIFINTSSGQEKDADGKKEMVAGGVLADSRVKVRVLDPQKAATKPDRSIRDLVEQFMSTALNQCTAGYSDVELNDLSNEQLGKFNELVQTEVAKEVGRDLGFAVVEAMMQNFRLMDDVREAMVDLQVARLQEKAAAHRAAVTRAHMEATGIMNQGLWSDGVARAVVTAIAQGFNLMIPGFTKAKLTKAEAGNSGDGDNKDKRGDDGEGGGKKDKRR